MEEENNVLREEAKKSDESLEAVAQRLDAGHDLIGERFGVKTSPLEPGSAADAVAMGSDGPHHVVVGGRIVVRGGRLQTADFDSIEAEAKDEAKGLWKRMVAL
jgi:hypothetical protein